MKKIQVVINDEKPITIDVKGDESVTVQFEDPPSGLENCKGQKPNIKIDGMRWRNEDFFQLSWLERNVSHRDRITIQYIDSEEQLTELTKEEKYIKPEEECSFCQKKRVK